MSSLPLREIAQFHDSHEAGQYIIHNVHGHSLSKDVGCKTQANTEAIAIAEMGKRRVLWEASRPLGRLANPGAYTLESQHAVCPEIKLFD